MASYFGNRDGRKCPVAARDATRGISNIFVLEVNEEKQGNSSGIMNNIAILPSLLFL